MINLRLGHQWQWFSFYQFRLHLSFLYIIQENKGKVIQDRVVIESSRPDIDMQWIAYRAGALDILNSIMKEIKELQNSLEKNIKKDEYKFFFNIIIMYFIF